MAKISIRRDSLVVFFSRSVRTLRFCFFHTLVAHTHSLSFLIRNELLPPVQGECTPPSLPLPQAPQTLLSPSKFSLALATFIREPRLTDVHSRSVHPRALNRSRNSHCRHPDNAVIVIEMSPAQPDARFHGTVYCPDPISPEWSRATRRAGRP